MIFIQDWINKSMKKMQLQKKLYEILFSLYFTFFSITIFEKNIE